MALYWRSPYKEVQNQCSQSEIKTTPRSLRSVKSALSRFSDPVSPQDWFDASMAAIKKDTDKSSTRNGTTTIKGILKEPQQNGHDEKHSASQKREELHSGKRFRKRVTFGANSETENSDSYLEFQAFRSTSAHQYRMVNRGSMDEYARHNLRKLLGFAPATSTLPSLSGKSMLPIPEPPSPVPQSPRTRLSTPPAYVFPTCGSGHQHFPSSTLDVTKTPIELSVDGFMTTPDPSMVVDEETREEVVPILQEDPTKSLKRHWTKSFTKSSDKKKTRHQSRGHPASAGVLHKYLTFRKVSNDQTTREQDLMASDFLKLRITGGGGFSVKPSSAGQEFRSDLSLPNPGHFSDRSDGQGMKASKVPATLTKAPDLHMALGANRPVTGSQQVHVRYGTPRIESKDGYLREHSMNKTAQIMSWLQDVKQKDRFQPSNSRLYALEVPHKL